MPKHTLGASNVSVRNVITSMRLISDIDWADLFESLSLVDKQLRVGSAFAAMDFPTRNLYRSAIEELARGSLSSEIKIAEQVLSVSSRAAAETHDPKERERVGDPGYHLIAEGRRAFERTIGFRPGARLRISRLSLRPGVVGYVGVILSVTAALLALGLWTLSASRLDANWIVLFALAGFLPTTEVVTALVNRAITWSFGATILPGLELADGVPESFRTLIAVPTLLTNEADLLEQVERLEVHYLAGSGGDLTFALLSDGVDADRETVAGDAHLLGVAAEAHV
jgi:cyclic beta-1,2-glucan synthetase